jgi:UDP-N-acetylmuramoyl-tripeptide--D-alanyl-D-alanine ligase
LSLEEIVAAIGAEVLASGPPGSPARATIDSAASGAGDLFFGLRGANRDGGEFAAAAIAAGAWGAVVGPASRQSFVTHRGTKDCRKAEDLCRR